MSNKYKCNLCGKIVNRDSNKKSIKSMCDETGKTGRLMKIEFNSEFTEKLCKEFLPNGLDLSSFTENEILFLETAFIQGANVMMNHMNKDTELVEFYKFLSERAIIDDCCRGEGEAERAVKLYSKSKVGNLKIQRVINNEVEVCRLKPTSLCRFRNKRSECTSLGDCKYKQ